MFLARVKGGGYPCFLPAAVAQPMTTRSREEGDFAREGGDGGDGDYCSYFEAQENSV